MSNTVEPMSEGIRRQRRSLIITSLILSFMKYGGITFKKISLYGSEITLSNVSAIYVFLWIMWFYFMIRYYQYFKQEGVAKIKSSLHNALTEICRHKIKAIVQSTYPNEKGSDQRFDYNILVSEKLNWYTIKYSGKEHLGHDSSGQEKTRDFEMNINLWSLWKEIFISYYQVFVNQSVILDYVIPLVVAPSAFIYCNLGDWHGSILNLFFFK